MKKLFSLLLIGALFAIALPKVQAQVSNGVYLKSVSSRSFVNDTITNATVKTQYASITGFQNIVTIQTELTKISGTTAGAVYLYGSLDNVTYVRLVPDSLLLSNVSTVQSKIWLVQPSSVQYYQVRVVPSGTQSTNIKTYAIYRKQP